MTPFRLRYHPAVSADLRGISRSLIDYAGAETTDRIVTALRGAARALRHAPHRGSIRSEIMPGLRAIPAGERGVIAFSVIDDRREVFIHMISYGGADWQSRVMRRPYRDLGE